MLTRAAGLASLGFALLALGILLGNLPLLYAGLGPLVFLLLGLAAVPPGTVHLRRHLSKGLAWVGEAVEVTWEVHVGPGPGLVLLADRLPEEFELVEGSNLRLLCKGFGPRTVRYTYRVRCAKRGVYPLPPTRWHVRHLLALLPPREGAAGEALQLRVTPRILHVRRLRPVRTRAVTPHPEADIARLGVATTDFREIRLYTPGDPVRLINWKATARRAHLDGGTPLVNEYETEGRKAVWLFVNGSRSLEVGTSLDNPLERAIEAASGVAYYFLRRGYRVGAYLYNAGDTPLYPDTGRRQYLVLARRLMQLRPAAEPEELPQAVDRCRRFLLLHRPLVVVVTRLDVFPSTALAEGVRRLVAMGARRRRARVLVLGVNAYFLASGQEPYHQEAVRLQAARTHQVVRQLRRLGASVVQWNPGAEGLATALSRQVRLP